jgi:hypothetical protein
MHPPPQDVNLESQKAFEGISVTDPLNPRSENPIRQEPEGDFQDMLCILWFLLGCLNPAVLLVVLLTVGFGQKKLRGRWLVVCGLVAGIVAVGFFDAVPLYLTPVLELTDFMRGNMVKLMHGADADDVVDLVLSHAGTWFCAQLPLGVPVGLIIAGDIIFSRRVEMTKTNAPTPESVLTWKS